MRMHLPMHGHAYRQYVGDVNISNLSKHVVID